ncbi:hypothetical protein EI983_12775 [Roseovarius faecimaris]|uniref:DUF3108 domain-containing protein n=1 Tax=Roseovarius faecimaris TaxID=2494550 RepID=A0A6I6IT76_9RHOB|nr:DUF6134 family protein [Roseovarius faecimaris]QGX99093.1 hypothetical protein EI983_12775 [Roseovarius faecimaris]
MRLLGLAVGLAVALAAPVHALSIPSNGKLSFDVVRKGKDIGDHTYSFSGTGSSFTVEVATDIAVKVPLIRTTAYSFQHASLETWKSGKLQQISSNTNDDGEPHQLKTAGKGTLPASLWNDDIVRSQKLMNTIDGRMMKVRVADLGAEMVETRRGAVTAHHYRMSGDLARDLWYDADGNLAQVAFKAEDGSTVMYIRK